MSNMNMPSQELQATDANREELVQEAVSTKGSSKTSFPISKPNRKYLAVTRKIDISNLPNGSMNDSISDGTFTVNFSTALEKRGPVPLGWSTWSSPPFSESANPDILVSGATTLTMTLSDPVQTFGFELEPNLFQTFTYTANLYSGNTLVGSVSRNISGDSGARLLALSADSIDRVFVSGPDAFAIANVRLQEVLQSQNKTILLASTLLSLLVVTPLIL